MQNLKEVEGERSLTNLQNHPVNHKTQVFQAEMTALVLKSDRRLLMRIHLTVCTPSV